MCLAGLVRRNITLTRPRVTPGSAAYPALGPRHDLTVEKSWDLG